MRSTNFTLDYANTSSPTHGSLKIKATKQVRLIERFYSGGGGGNPYNPYFKGFPK